MVKNVNSKIQNLLKNRSTKYNKNRHPTKSSDGLRIFIIVRESCRYL